MQHGQGSLFSRQAVSVQSGTALGNAESPKLGQGGFHCQVGTVGNERLYNTVVMCVCVCVCVCVRACVRACVCVQYNLYMGSSLRGARYV